MDRPITPKQAFKLAYRNARMVRKVDTNIRAYFVADRAIDTAIYQGGWDYKPFLAVFRGVLWAIHWQFEEAPAALPKWTSERWLGFSMGPDGGSSWYDNPRIPS